MPKNGGGDRKFVGPYELIEVIGETPLVEVWKARHRETRMLVALKWLRPAVPPAVVDRFIEECRMLARMKNANIARILHTGTSDVRRYLVTELLDPGVPITMHCEMHKVHLKERLRLLAGVAEPIHHAHTNGIIHRDVTPSNVLSHKLPEDTQGPGDPAYTAKVIDFGVAKAMSESWPGTLLPERGRFVGKPDYMSPEQVGALPDIDGRTDVYSLGVLLYELLLGAVPFAEHDLAERPVAEIREIVGTVTPPWPAERMTDLEPEQAECLSKLRGETARHFRSELRRDLDPIVRKAMAKDRADRYKSARHFALDLQRYLNGEPVAATLEELSGGGRRAMYKAGKYVRRYPGRVAVVSAFFLLVGVSLTIMSVMYFGAKEAQKEATKQAEIANIARDDAVEAEEKAREAEKEAKEAHGRAEQTRQVAERTSYVAQIGAAAGALAEQDVAQARQILDKVLRTQPQYSECWEMRYLRGQLDHSIPTFRPAGLCGTNGVPVQDLAFMTNGRGLLVGAGDKLQVLDTASGAVTAHVPSSFDASAIPDLNRVIALAVSPAGDKLAFARADGSVWVSGVPITAPGWPNQPESRPTPMRKPGLLAPYALAFSPDGRNLAIGISGSKPEEGYAEVWTIEAQEGDGPPWKLLRSWKAHEYAVQTVEFGGAVAAG